MKKMIMVGLVSIISVVCSAGPAEDAFNTGVSAFSNKNYVAAQTAFESIITENLSTNVDFLAMAQYKLANALWYQGKQNESLAAYRLSITGYPTATEKSKSEKYLGLATILARANKLAESQLAWETLITNYTSIARPIVLATAQLRLGEVLERQGKTSDAQQSYMKCVINWVDELGCSNNSIPMMAFEKINPKILSADDYKSFLQSAIKAIPATEENARFLGRLKSELGKMQ